MEKKTQSHMRNMKNESKTECASHLLDAINVKCTRSTDHIRIYEYSLLLDISEQIFVLFSVFWIVVVGQ